MDLKKRTVTLLNTKNGKKRKSSVLPMKTKCRRDFFPTCSDFSRLRYQLELSLYDFEYGVSGSLFSLFSPPPLPDFQRPRARCYNDQHEFDFSHSEEDSFGRSGDPESAIFE